MCLHPYPKTGFPFLLQLPNVLQVQLETAEERFLGPHILGLLTYMVLREENHVPLLAGLKPRGPARTTCVCKLFAERHWEGL